MNRLAFIAAMLVGAAAVSWFFPLFRIVSIERVAERELTTFDAAEFAGQFWTEQLVPALEQATEVETLLAAIRSDPQEARVEFGRTVGVSRSYYYFLRGRGTVVGVERNRVAVSMSDDAADPDLVLLTGPLFGNTVRNATGLLDASDFAYSQHFNDISTELNRIVMDRVLPPIREEAAIGRPVQFVGCAEVTNERTDLRPLKAVPLQVSFE